MPGDCLFETRGEDVFEAQKATAFGDQRQQAVDVGMFARILARVIGMFGVELKPFPGRFHGDGTVNLTQMVIDGK